MNIFFVKVNITFDHQRIKSSVSENTDFLPLYFDFAHLPQLVIFSRVMAIVTKVKADMWLFLN